ncbi:transposase [Mycobacterium sp. 1274756.6]|uniref:transposase n=1 Tax=Mycobacterium sp. 1274756.6 TaxID=1834076 RepID=UPI003369F521
MAAVSRQVHVPGCGVSSSGVSVLMWVDHRGSLCRETTKDHYREERNGPRPRTLTAVAGDLELRIPKLRMGSFFPRTARSSAPSRSVPVRGGDGGLPARHLRPQG